MLPLCSLPKSWKILIIPINGGNVEPNMDTLFQLFLVNR